jgi:GT2 family glycosyltransferase
MSSLRLVVVVLNWNNVADTLRCLEALAASDYEGFEVVIVDNASTDGSVAGLRERYPALTILENERNLGYTGGNNVGIDHALKRGAEYVLLLNDDSVVAPDALSALMAAAADHPEAGFLGAKLLSLDEPTKILSAGGVLAGDWNSAHRGMGERDAGQYDGLAEVDWLSGCALLVSREAIHQVGILDSSFFAYYEDVEWCFRGRRAGFKVVYVPDARVWHPDGQEYYSNSPRVTYYMARNHLLFMKKHLGVAAVARRLACCLLMLVNWTVRPKWRHKRAQCHALLRALVDFGSGRFGQARGLG